jgi:uridine phosphorylase
MKSNDPAIFSPEVFHSYIAARRKVPPKTLSVPSRLVATFHRLMFNNIRSRIHGHFVDWYYDKRLVVGTLKGTDFAVLHSFIGSSAASMMLEEMIASGVRQIIEVGMCGGMAPSVRVGDIVVADRAFVDEGTSSHYFDSPNEFLASKRLTDALKQALREAGMGFKTGGVWTTDAPYRETRATLRKFKRQEAVGVNMETSALFAIGNYRGVEVGSLQVVSDMVGEKVWRPAFHEKIVAERSVAASNLALDALGGV